MRSNNLNKNSRHVRFRRERSCVEVDVTSLLSIENRCGGCGRDERCCCSSYEVCVTAPEMKRIIKVLPEAARFAPHLLTAGGYDNVFDEEEQGLYSIDTTEEGLCLFAYWSNSRTRCSLHSAALALGLPLEKVKPKVCMLWPMHFSEGSEVLAIHDDALEFACNSPKKRAARSVSPGLVEAIELIYGEGCGEQVAKAAEQGERRTLLVPRR